MARGGRRMARQERLASALALPRRSIPLLGKRKKGQRRTPRLQKQGRFRSSQILAPPCIMSAHANPRHRHPDSRRRRRGPVRGAARQEGAARARRHHRGEGPARQVRLHPHGAGRLQRRARADRLGRAAFHGHHRGRRLAQPAGAGVAAGQHRADPHPRAGERDRLLLRPQSRRHRASEGVRRADLRPHRAQGRSHRHRDRQPAVRADLAARRAAAGGSPRARSHPGGRRLGPRRRLHARHAHRRAAAGPRAGDAARDRRRADDVSLSHAVRRQVVRRHGDGAARRACRCATWRWCSSIRPDCWRGRARA